jgi:hypothetical protein
MKNQNFTLSFSVDQSPEEVFNTILQVHKWWSGLYGEEFEGKAEKVGDEFSFRAGGGAHYSKQKLIELVAGKKIVWLVTDSELTFLKKKNEWTGTKLIFDISRSGSKTQINFTHEGLVPEIECYDSCNPAWTSYLLDKLLPLIAGAKEKVNA